tara:strand:- start:358 stop:528 length:171 start_codon:yes stop_codon:yes gene_type:complete
MEVGTLVTHEDDHYEGIGIVVDEHSRDGEYTMVTVQWLDGMGVGLYWTDELEAICS